MTTTVPARGGRVAGVPSRAMVGISAPADAGLPDRDVRDVLSQELRLLTGRRSLERSKEPTNAADGSTGGPWLRRGVFIGVRHRRSGGLLSGIWRSRNR